MALTITPTNLVKVASAGTGRGDLVFGVAIPTYRGIEALTDGATYSYAIQQQPSSWEFGRGVWTTSTKTLTRTVVDSSEADHGPIAIANGTAISLALLAEDVAHLQGEPGPAFATFSSLTTFKAGPITNAIQVLQDPSIAYGLFQWETANAPYTADDVNIIKANTTPLSTGAWIRQKAVSVYATGVAPLTVQDRLDQLEVYAAVQSGNTPAQNLAALKAALSYVAVGGTVIVPKGTYTIDVTGGLSNAATINKRMNIRIDGRLQTNGHTIQTNPPYIFKVTSDDVAFIGNGTIAGDGTVDQQNLPDDTQFPGLVYVVGVARFSFAKSLTMDTPPKEGIVLVNCTNANVGFKGMGGPTVYSDSGYFYIRASGGGQHVFEGIVAPETAGARVVNCIFLSGTFGDSSYCTIRNNYVDAWEKIVYTHGDGHIVNGNKGRGANTDWIRLWGADCTAYDNIASDGHGGISAYNCPRLKVYRNTFSNMSQVGIFVSEIDGYAGGFPSVQITNNVLKGRGTDPSNGVSIAITASHAADMVVTGNDIDSFGSSGTNGGIKFSGTGSAQFQRLKVSDNDIRNASYGVIINQASRYNISGNRFTSIANYGITTANSAYGNFINNRSLGGVVSPGIQGLDLSQDQASENRWTDGITSGLATLVAGTATVNTTEILTGDRISLSRTTTGGTVGNISVGTITSGTSFVINSSSASDTSVVYWQIIH